MDRLQVFRNMTRSDANGIRAAKNYNRYLQFIDSGQFSDDNEYFQQMQYAKNTRDFNRLYAAALTRQQEINDYNRQFSDSAALRDEQRDYDSASSQIARERAAGLNPDLIDGAGLQAPMSPVQAPGIDAVQTPALSDPAETFGLVLQGVSTVSSVFSALSGGLNSFLEFGKGAATFGDFVRGVKSDADMKKTAADLAAGLKPHQIASATAAARSANVSADVAEGTSLSQQISSLVAAASQRLNLVGAMSSQFTDKDYASDEILSQAVADYLGLDPSDSHVLPLVRQLKRYNSSPQMQKEYASARIAHKSQAALNEARPYDLVLAFETARAETELIQQNADKTAAAFEDTFNRLIMTQQTAETLASGVQSDVNAAAAASQLNEEQAARDFKIYLNTLQYQANQLAKIDKELASMKANPNEYDAVTYNALLLRRNSIALLQSREMHRVNSLVQEYYLTYHKANVVSYTGKGVVAQYFNKGQNAFYETLFSPSEDVNLPAEDVSSKFKTIINSMPVLHGVAKLL